MTNESVRCPTCRCAMWDEVDWLGRIYWRHPTRQCVAPPPSYYAECDICGEEDVKLPAPYDGSMVVLCSDVCRAIHRQRTLKVEQWKRRLERLGHDFERNDISTITDKEKSA